MLGSGSIGCWVGGVLTSAADVTLVGRTSVLDPIRDDGLTVVDLDGLVRSVHPDRLVLSDSPAVLADSDVVLVSVKAKDTATAISEVAPLLSPATLIVSLQNGLNTRDRIEDALARQGIPLPVFSGVVGFNVVRTGPSRWRRATSGEVILPADPALATFVDTARRARLPIAVHDDLDAIQRAKLLLNLNNAVNALSGLPLREELLDRDLRRVLAACQREALAVFAAAAQPVARLTPLPATVTARVLGTPTAIFRILAKANLRIDASARSSMADDLSLGRRTEIDELQGEIVRRGTDLGVPTPVCAAVARLVHEAESADAGQACRWSGPELRSAVGLH